MQTNSATLSNPREISELGTLFSFGLGAKIRDNPRSAETWARAPYPEGSWITNCWSLELAVQLLVPRPAGQEQEAAVVRGASLPAGRPPAVLAGLPYSGAWPRPQHWDNERRTGDAKKLGLKVEGDDVTSKLRGVRTAAILLCVGPKTLS